ncbi:MAG: cellulase family glycosylhydrolase, partial [Eubacteriales bacterium]
MQRKANKVICLGCAVGVVAASVSILCGAAASSKAFTALDKSDFLKTRSRTIVNARGQTVTLRGVNIGGWLLQESRMCPNNADDKVWGYYDTLKVLFERFGEEKANELLNTYLDNWITNSDLDYLKNLGVNCVRVPFWYRNFQSDDDGTWIRNKNGEIDFSRLDWIVAECGKRGIYVIFDMHGAPGFQSNDHSCGKVNASELFDLSLDGLKYRNRTAEIWTELAKHFKGNPTVAAYDLLNEPMSGFTEKERNDCRLWHFYNRLYKAIRAVDRDHMITVEGIWELDNLPNPKLFCWQNIVYQLHIYNRATPEIDKKITDIKDHAKWNIPVLVGEFQAGGMREYTLNAFNDNNLSWLTWTYKGVKTQKSDWFLFAGEPEIANLQDDTFEQIKAKWGKPCKTASSFTENTELANTLKVYLSGTVIKITGVPGSAEPAGKVELYEPEAEIPDTGADTSSAPLKVVFGTATLVGVGTLAELSKKK